MAFDAFCYSPKSQARLPGETQDDKMASKGAFGVLSFELGAENTIDIGAITGGGGAGKASPKEFTVTKKTDTSSGPLFTALCTGDHYDDMVIELRRSAGVSSQGTSGVTFMKFHMHLVMVQDISWSGSDGDDICEETVIFKFGAIQIHYHKQDRFGKMDAKPIEAMWSFVKNKVGIEI